MTTVLIVILILLLIGAVPAYGNRADWGPYPVGGLGLLIVIILILILLGYR